MNFTPAHLLARLRALPSAQRYWVAYSGGLDSHVLLHALAALRAELGEVRLAAVHVHHGLHTDAELWTEHCTAVCGQLGVPLTVLRVDARAAAGESPEAGARAARYQALEELLGAGDVLLTAHHLDDQAETLLLQLLRGSGPHGLAAMPDRAALGGALHGRPLLDAPREALRRYAHAEGLSWVEDSSNAELAFDRNYVRHEILPRLAVRWPSARQTLTRSAGHCAEAASLLDELAALDLAAVGGDVSSRLSVAALLDLSPPRRRNVLRAWLRGLGLALPSQAQLAQVEQVLESDWDTEPCVHWIGAEVRRYRDELHAMRPLSPHDPSLTLQWNVDAPLDLPALDGRLRATRVRGEGVRLSQECTVTVRFRAGGERCRPAGRAETHTLKKLFQDAGVPPWRRERIPLIFIGDDLAAVAGLWVCEPFAAGADDDGWVIDWDADRRG